MKTTEKIDAIRAYVRDNFRWINNKDDVEQEAIVIALEHPDVDNIAKICQLAKKRFLKEEEKHTRKRAESVYNADGECLDDNYYFVDQSTVEQYGERKSEVTDEQREKVYKMEQCLQFIDAIYGRSFSYCYNKWGERGRATVIKRNTIGYLPKWNLARTLLKAQGGLNVH